MVFWNVFLVLFVLKKRFLITANHYILLECVQQYRMIEILCSLVCLLEQKWLVWLLYCRDIVNYFISGRPEAIFSFYYQKFYLENFIEYVLTANLWLFFIEDHMNFGVEICIRDFQYVTDILELFCLFLLYLFMLFLFLSFQYAFGSSRGLLLRQ